MEFACLVKLSVAVDWSYQDLVVVLFYVCCHDIVGASSAPFPDNDLRNISELKNILVQETNSWLGVCVGLGMPFCGRESKNGSAFQLPDHRDMQLPSH